MSDPNIKLRVSVDGAAEAAKDIDAVSKATKEAGKAVEENTEATKAASKARIDAAVAARRAAAEAAEEARRAREAVAAVDAQIATEKKAVTAKAEAARAAERKAAAEEAERATEAALAKQAERTALAVERLALAKGKSASVASEMGDIAAGKVLDGAAPGRVLYGARSGFAAEAAAMKELAAQSAPAAAGAARVGEEVAKTAGKTQGLISAGRLLANAFLPDMWVARTLSGGRALIGVLSGLSAGVLAVGGVITAVAGGAFYLLWRRMKDAEETAKKLNERIDAQAEAIEKAGERFDDFARVGVIMGEAADSYEKVTKNSEDYAFSLEHQRAASEGVAEAEQRRIALSERAAKANITLDFGRKIAAARSPEEKRALEAERDALVSGEKSKADQARAASEEKRLEREVGISFAEKVQKETALRAARESHATLAGDVESRAAALRTGVLPGLGFNTRALDDPDKERRKLLLDQNIERAREDRDKLRADITKRTEGDPTKETDADRDKLISYAKAIGALRTYKKELAELAEVQAKAAAAEKDMAVFREKFEDLVSRMNEAHETRKIVGVESTAEAEQRAAARKAAGIELDKANAARAREATVQQDAAALVRDAAPLTGRSAADAGIVGESAAEFDRESAALGPALAAMADKFGASAAELAKTRSVIGRMLSALEAGQGSAEWRAELTRIEERAARIEAAQHAADARARNSRGY